MTAFRKDGRMRGRRPPGAADAARERSHGGFGLTILARTPLWIAVDKPPGLPSRPAPNHAESALSLLEAWLLDHEPGPHPPGVVHRLDRDTSGLLLFSLDPWAHRELVRAFAEGDLRKEYIAIVRGHPRPRRGLIDLPLARNASGRTQVTPRGAPARTRYATVRSWMTASLLDLQPLTGRTHQIRAHLAARGTPILGDPLYGTPASAGEETGLAPPRLCLHARRLRLPAALSPGGMAGGLWLEAPWPQDLARFVRALDDARGA